MITFIVGPHHRSPAVLGDSKVYATQAECAVAVADRRYTFHTNRKPSDAHIAIMCVEGYLTEDK